MKGGECGAGSFGLGFRTKGEGCLVEGLGLRVSDFGCRLISSCSLDPLMCMDSLIN